MAQKRVEFKKTTQGIDYWRKEIRRNKKVFAKEASWRRKRRENEKTVP